MTTIKVNGDRISALCGNRGGIHDSVAYAGVEAIKDAMGLGRDAAAAIFANGAALRVCRWQYAPGTYRAEPVETLYEVTVVRDDNMADPCAADGDYAEACLAAMQSALAANAERIKRRGPAASNDPLDVGFDPKIHRAM